MINTLDRAYQRQSTAGVAKYVDALKAASVSSHGTFDSAEDKSCIARLIPENLQAVFDEKDQGLITKAILDGISRYEREHGTSVPADLVEQAIHCAYATTDDARQRFSLPTLDSASSNASDPQGLQPNRAVVAILAMMSEAIPFAHYLPADIGSNEARLAIMQHQADTDFGAYKANQILDGAYSGDAYISSSRVHQCAIDASGNATGKITCIQSTENTCDPNGLVSPLIRGRAMVYVMGRVAAREVDGTGSGPSAISGGITISGTDYAIAGSINTDTGAISLTTTPPLPSSIPLLVEGFIDYERNPSITPKIITSVQMFKLHANPWRVFTQQTIDSRTQLANELGLDPYSESVIGIQQQFANERHYKVLQMAMRLAQNNQADFEFGWATGATAQKTREMVFQDFATPLGAVDQQMALETMNHGVTHLYVGKFMRSMLLSLPSTLFVPSGLPTRPGITRVGRLFGMYDVYYAPKVVPESVDSSGHQSATVLCIGRATDVTRNPFILGDAVAPSVIPLAVNMDLKTGAGFYARNYTCVNPHGPSSMGCALINITNLT